MDVNRESIKNQVDLSLKLVKHIFSTEAGGDSNLVFSPLSINVILSLIAVGSDSPTRDQLLAFLKSDSTDHLNTFYSQIVGHILADGSLTGGPSLSVANGLWLDRTLPIKPSFKYVVDTVYKAASESVDFQHKASEVVDEVNLWVEKKTKSRINHILPLSAVNNRTRLLFASALYFNGAWSQEFDARMTKDHEFHLLNGSSIQVPFMSNYVKQSVKAFSGFKVLQLSYNRGNDYKKRRSFSMYFFLPDAMDGLPSLLDKASSESGFIERHLPTHIVSVGKFLIPKFQISFQFEGSRVLEELGVVAPFNPTGGGLTEMVDSPEGSELYVSKILHGSFIEVNEGGTEAAEANMDVNSKPITNQVDLSLKLAKHVFSTQAKGDSNLVFSPLSINVILSLIAVGSNSPTRDELLAFLMSDSIDLNTCYSQIVDNIRVDGSLTGGPCLSVASGLWIDSTLPLKPSFKHVVYSVYKAASESVDFRNKASEVVDQVNSWAEKETKGLINNLLPPSAIDDTTRLIFASALYFKGEWFNKFNDLNTQDHEFHLLNGSSIQVPFMRTCEKQYVKAFSGFKVLKLSYNPGNDYKERRSFSMYFFLPDAMDGLPSLLDKASSESGFLERHLPTKLVSVGKFRIPKFQISFQFEVSRVLGELGVKAPFNPRGGGLTEMVDSPEGSELYVSKILQKSFIEVNEEGTEAAAVSVSLMGVGAGFRIEKEDDKTDFVADHPFLFAIREDFSGAILFVGTVLHPQYNSKNLPSKPTPALPPPWVFWERSRRPSVGPESMGLLQSLRPFVGGSENKELLEWDLAEIERLFMSVPNSKKMGD
nr:serpin-ZX-like [Ipomoea batatas]